MGLNWNEFDSASPFYKLAEGTEHKLVLANWEKVTKFEKLGVEFDVLEADGVGFPIPKKFLVSSYKLIKKIRPLIEKAEAMGKAKFRVSILKIGDKYETAYSVKELEV